MELTACPECGLPAEIIDRDTLASTDGPIEHVHVQCVDRHRFFLPAERLPVAARSVRATVSRGAADSPGPRSH